MKLKGKLVCCIIGVGAGLVLADSGSPNQPFKREPDASSPAYVGPPVLESRAPASSLSLESARKIVDDAIAKASELNKARMENPTRNQYIVDESGKKVKRSPALPLMDVTTDIAAAAAMVAEADAASLEANGSSISNNNSNDKSKGASASQAQSGRFWMETIKRLGTSPYSGDPTYKIFRNVKDYGAKGDGKTDDTAAIQRAISDGKRCGSKCSGSTTRNAIVYLPMGNYLVSSSIMIYYGTQFIGDATNWPTITAASSFVGLGVLTTDARDNNGTGSEWYVNTASFYRQIRNLYVDITRTHPGASICGIHYQVAQATSLQNVEIMAKAGTTQRGLFTENGSGGLLADIKFTGGQYGIYGGNQQFTAQRLTFQGCDTAVSVIWDWGWMWKTVNVFNCKIGFALVKNDGGNGENGSYIGSAAFLDSVFVNVEQAIVIAPPNVKTGSATVGLVLDNVAFQNVGIGVIDKRSKVWLGGVDGGQNWSMGPVYNGTRGETFNFGVKIDMSRDVSLLGSKTSSNAILAGNPYFERTKPQYTTSSNTDFVHLKDLGAKGDGKTDDTAAVQGALDKFGASKILFADAGVYLLSDTVTIPPGARIVGEAWTQFAATGKKFSNASDPHVMIRVGQQNATGSVEMQDLIFTTKGPTPGAVLVEWNIQADKQGAAGMWDCHARLGGATGTQLTPAECPAPASKPKAECQAAALVMHITSEASGYFENMWLWTADHMIDDADLKSGDNPMPMVSIYTARGLLVESQRPTWLYGTASEHAVMYQYNIFYAASVFAGMLQTEPPYFQPSPEPPSPFGDSLDVFDSDPSYYNCEINSTVNLYGCDAAWGLMVQLSQDIYIASAGVYSFYNDFKQDCIARHSCQRAAVYLSSNFHRVRVQQLVTIGANVSVYDDDGSIYASDILAVTETPNWSQVTVYDAVEMGGEQIVAPEPDIEPCGTDDKWATLDDLNNAIDTIPENCVALYALPILYRMLSDALANYTDLIADGKYDNKFDAYVKYIKDQTPLQLDAFMDRQTGAGNKYFTCTFETNGKNISEATSKCPLGDWLSRTIYTKYTIWFTLDDHDGFFKELQSTFGIMPDWVKFGEKVNKVKCATVQGCGHYQFTYEGYPLPADNYNVDNPKTVIEKAGDGFNKTLVTIAGYILQLQAGDYLGVPNDVIQVLVMPVSLAVQAVESMNQVVEIGTKEQEEHKKNLILLILSIIFLVIPFADAVTAEMGVVVATLGRIISLIGAAGNAALTIYDVYADPASAPLAIMGLLMGVGGTGSLGRTAEDMGKMANMRRAMKDGDVAKMGTVFKKNDAVIQKMVGFCRKK